LVSLGREDIINRLRIQQSAIRGQPQALDRPRPAAVLRPLARGTTKRSPGHGAGVRGVAPTRSWCYGRWLRISSTHRAPTIR
jgi:hypothetical protein